ncbi:S-methyl-5-thioribose-1-phosphate isomerase [Synchytrium microbalum]|uniref:Methylthioribose-1-phosphate isomerase n=1 Tax=Synchytrium microbalum TaxID=1806994 RepID=A0A507C5G2_9FUNG|nr:S-methyl-5-thioribose-1-phosphate isomerase [Synchytrium microbalum]TPX34721.1 S-methyl-5-thioribose-1-phosphate isomerase [Synchytrium microbalum]
MATLEAIKYRRSSLEIINQLLLPYESVFEEIKSVEDGHTAIKTMKVRGAPAIAIVAALSLAIELHVHTVHAAHSPFATPSAVVEYVLNKLEYLKTSRPTAVNLFDAARKLAAVVETSAQQAGLNVESKEASQTVVEAYISAAEAMLRHDVEDNRNIGRFGAEFVSSLYQPNAQIKLLTHCNTGSLATAGWGTALGIVRDMHQSGRLNHVFCTETRPYNQGSRLTAYELVYEKIPSTLVTDSMVGALLKKGGISAIVVGADRVTANGDTANKIGTYQLALLAHYHKVPFLVAAPSTSIDLSLASGDLITIEERGPVEVVTIRGQVVEDIADFKEPRDASEGVPPSVTIRIAAPGIGVWNPSFDVTPASLITGIVTERGVAQKAPGSDIYDLKTYLSQSKM